MIQSSWFRDKPAFSSLTHEPRTIHHEPIPTVIGLRSTVIAQRRRRLSPEVASLRYR